MRTNYKVETAVQGTNENEIAKAKREYRKGVERGEFQKAKNVMLTFNDSNSKVTVKFTDIDDYVTLGYADILN